MLYMVCKDYRIILIVFVFVWHGMASHSWEREIKLARYTENQKEYTITATTAAATPLSSSSSSSLNHRQIANRTKNETADFAFYICVCVRAIFALHIQFIYAGTNNIIIHSHK